MPRIWDMTISPKIRYGFGCASRGGHQATGWFGTGFCDNPVIMHPLRSRSKGIRGGKTQTENAGGKRRGLVYAFQSS
jgi:hypothetical protein